MARRADKQKAIELRLQGRSYSQIKSILSVSKSTLSGWLKDYPLSEERIKELRDWNEKRIENYKKTCKIRKEKILERIYLKEKKKILPLSKRDLFIAGLFLHWGEGGKRDTEVVFSNTNPSMIKFFMYWVEKCLGVNRKKIKIKLHLYSDMDIENEICFWINLLKIEREQLINPYIKKNKIESITYKGGFGHGTCNVMVRNAILSRQILMGIKVVGDYFNLKYK